MTARRRALTILAVAIVALAAGGWFVWWRLPPKVVHGGCGGCNVLLITIDTLRSDRVGAFGGTGHLTPALDRLAGDALRFTRAYASAPLTLPSHASIMTAVSPPVHGVRNNSLFRLGETLPTLATVLKSAGYRTGAFVGAFVLDARFGLNRGFDVYDDRYGEKAAGDPSEGAERRAEDVVRPAAAWIVNPQSTIVNPQSTIVNPQSAVRNPQSDPQSAIRNPQSPWFAWVHLYDPHAPYRAPEPYASQHAPYDAEVAYTDAMVGTLLDELKASNQLDRTVVAFTADHGESLGEHGEATHGVFAYDVTMVAPSFIWAGSRIRGRAFDDVTALLDLAPTVLDLVGLASPSTFEGRSLLPAVNHDDAAGPAAYIEAMDANLTRNWAPLTGVVSGQFKLIDLPIPELYDLASDPHETANLFSRDAERARTLSVLLRNRATQFASHGAAAVRTALSTDARERLQALGYVTSVAEPAGRVYTDADDPKRLIGAATDLDRAVAAFHDGSRAAAMSAVAAIMRAHPAFTTAASIFASMQRDTGDLPGAISTLEAVVRGGHADQSVMVVLAGYFQELGALDRSAALLDAVIAAHPDYAEAYNSLGVVYSRQGRHAEARQAYRKVLDLDPTSAKAYENLGVDELNAGDLAAAATDLYSAVSLDPRLAGARNALAAVYLRQGRTAEAIDEWKTAVRLDPRLFDALYNLGTVLYNTGRRDEARPYLEQFVREAPRGRYAADIAKLTPLLSR